MPVAKVSILIPAYNAERYIGEAIISALNQTWENIEVIVVNDGSQDKTFAVAKSFHKKDVKVINQVNKGAAAARNTAFKASSGEYIQYLDADDLLAKDKIKLQMQMIQQRDKGYLYASSWGVFYDTVAKVHFRPSSLWNDFDSSIDWLVEAWTNQVWMHPSAWLVARHLIENAGEWNESLSLHDDGEFFCRVLLKSKGIKFCEQAKSYYRKGISDSLSNTFSEKAILSHLKICKLYEQYLLNVEDSYRTRAACATNFMHFHFSYYPSFKIFRKQAMQEAKRLGGTKAKPNGTTLFHMLKKVVGWQMARIIEKFYYGNGINKSAIKARLIQKLKVT